MREISPFNQLSICTEYNLFFYSVWKHSGKLSCKHKHTHTHTTLEHSSLSVWLLTKTTAQMDHWTAVSHTHTHTNTLDLLPGYPKMRTDELPTWSIIKPYEVFYPGVCFHLNWNAFLNICSWQSILNLMYLPNNTTIINKRQKKIHIINRSSWLESYWRTAIQLYITMRYYPV